MNRRPLLLREVACRSSKEKAAPHAGDQSVSHSEEGGGTLWLQTCDDSDAPRLDTLSSVHR